MQFVKGLFDQLIYCVVFLSKFFFYQQIVSKVEIKILRRWIFDVGEYGIGFVEVFVFGVFVFGYYVYYVGCFSRCYFDVVIFDYYIFFWLYIQSGCSELINGGIWFFFGNYVVGENFYGGCVFIFEYYVYDC